MVQGQHGQERARQDFQCANDDPSRPTGHHCRPPPQTLPLLRLRDKTQEIDLFAYLCNQREHHGRRCPKKQQIELAALIGGSTLKLRPVRHRAGIHVDDENERQQLQHNPRRLSPELELADGGYAVGDQGNNHHRTNEITDHQRYIQQQLQRHGHDCRFDREEDKRKRGVDQRGDGGADVAEASAAGKQVYINTVASGVVADGYRRQKDDQRHGADGCDRVVESIVDSDGPTDGFQRQKGNRSQSRISNAGGGPAPCTLCGKPQGVVFERLVGHPLIVIAPYTENALSCGHRCVACVAG